MTVRSSLRAAAIPLAREARAKFDDAEVRQARLLVRRLQVGPPRVVHFGASESIHIGLHDVDRRTLPIMIRDQLADRADEIDGAEFLGTFTRQLKDAIFPSRQKADTGRRNRRS